SGTPPTTSLRGGRLDRAPTPLMPNPRPRRLGALDEAHVHRLRVALEHLPPEDHIAATAPPDRARAAREAARRDVETLVVVGADVAVALRLVEPDHLPAGQTHLRRRTSSPRRASRYAVPSASSGPASSASSSASRSPSSCLLRISSGVRA